MSTHKFISKYVATGNISTITFNNFSGYNDLILYVSARDNYGSTAGNMLLNINDDRTDGNYANVFFQGSGSGIGSGTVPRMIGDNDTSATAASIFNSIKIFIPAYSTSRYKMFNSESTQEELSTAGYTMLTGNSYNSSTPVTSITLTNRNSSSFVEHSSFYLYGINNS
jgi:hypothetical protein